MILCLILTCDTNVAADEKPPARVVRRLLVSPSPAPVPILRYRLLPTLHESTPGNAVYEFMKCFAEQNRFFHGKQAVAEREKLLKVPTGDEPLFKLGGDYGGSVGRMADDAARMRSADWQLLRRLRRDGVGTLLPDVQQTRSLGKVLQVRTRGRIAQGDFGGAVASLRTTFALGRTYRDHPCLIGHLVGTVIVRDALTEVEEMAQIPGSPNLFWALHSLPRPLLDLRAPLQGEWAAFAGPLNHVEGERAMADAELSRAADAWSKMLKLAVSGGQGHDAVARWRKLAADQGHIAAARERLRRARPGRPLDGLPPLQIVLLDERLAFKVMLDGLSVWCRTPFPQATAFAKRLPRPDPDGLTLVDLLTPTVWKVRVSQLRLQQRLAMLRAVEAVRLYADGHRGRVPAKWADFEVPVPHDPVTGKPFGYRVEAGRAVIDAPNVRLGPLPAKSLPPVRYVVEVTR